MATAVLTRLSELREARARQRTLRRELSGYTTEGALNDLEAAVARAEADAEAGPETDTAPETQQIRRILAAQRTAVLGRG